MGIDGKYIFNLIWVTSISLLIFTEAFASTVFSLEPNDVKGKIYCDYLEIKNNQALCTSSRLIITYDIARLKKIQVAREGKIIHFQKFTQETIEKINGLNSEIKSNNSKTRQAPSDLHKFSITQKFSSSIIPDTLHSLEDNFKDSFGKNTFATILLASGFLLYLIGSIGFLLATFRVSLLWGFSCIFLPFVSLIFLFIHWKVALKPFILLLLGLGIIFSGIMLVPTDQTTHNTTKTQPTAAVDPKNSVSFECSGKVYCSEMISCAEAKFYLRNCPGTKLDGDKDGIPCEKQWCGN